MASGVYDVYHLKAEVWIDSQSSATPVHFPSDYEHVARVKAKNLEEVFDKTNSVDGPWWENADVQCVKKSRSTSIDDVAVSPSGDIHVLGLGGSWLLAREARTQTAEMSPTIEPTR